MQDLKCLNHGLSRILCSEQGGHIVDSAYDTKTVRHTDIWKSEIGKGRLKNQHFLLQGSFEWTYVKYRGQYGHFCIYQ